ncbi:MAG TPA: FAD-dependent monooxygenase [Pseudonocardiaceae bacterium]|jgi:2-polyprenyl-6-methoxyphenol hydroxylase-like FAD-dependent oxidoreductase|nr:FAD-dependent monooxygenase [Pseudonocardiaceae bacterium]
MNPQNRRVLISGASVAGPVLAYWLARYGFEPTLVEAADAPRDGGYPIDVRGQALSVADRMGLLPELRAAGLDTEGLSFVNAENRTLAAVDMRAMRKAAASADIELCRGDLVRILHAATSDGIEYRFGNRITELTQHEGGVHVEFEHGPGGDFDLVLGADGLHSGVRKLTFGPEQQFLRYLGYYFGGVEVASSVGMPERVVLRNEPGKLIGIYRYHDRAGAFFMFASRHQVDYDYRDLAAPGRIFTERFADLRWRGGVVEQVAAAGEMYFDSLSQVHLATWSKGRIALVGDAGYCPTLITGQGTSLAMIGAYLLAGELAAAGGDHRVAFARYEERFRPAVTAAQRGTSQGAAMLIPATSAAIWRRNQLVRLAGIQVLVSRLTRRFARPAAELPAYPQASGEPSLPPAARR